MNESIVLLSLVTHADAYTLCICARRTKSWLLFIDCFSGVLFSDYFIYAMVS